MTRARFGRTPVRSPLLRGCCLFLGVHEMFQFPRCPPRLFSVVLARTRAGCPIRRSRDQSLRTAPPRLSQRCHVLHRHAAPRHTPIAHTVFPGKTIGNQRGRVARPPNGSQIGKVPAKRQTLNAKHEKSNALHRSSFIVQRSGVPSPLNRDDARLSLRSGRWVVAKCNSLERR